MGEAKRRMAATADLPYRRVPGGWRLDLSEGREVAVGTTFDAKRGYLVTLGFKDSAAINMMEGKGARALAQAHARGSRLFDELVEASLRADVMNIKWRRVGRPTTPLTPEQISQQEPAT
jgi:hypothetical protein